MIALKAQWTITAGILIGQPMDQFTEVFIYDSVMHSKDQQLEKFAEISKTVYDKAYNLSHPGVVNWTHVDFIWL